MTMPFRFCLAASEALGDEDLAALTDAIEAYIEAGASASDAESMAVNDIMALVRAERADLHGLVRQQHPALFNAEQGGAYTGADGQATAPGAAGNAGAAGTQAAAADPVRRPAGAVPRQITALGITAERERTGHAALIGAVARTPRELAKLAQVFRDPRVETFRLFFTKGDEIVHATGVSSRSVDQVGIIPAGMTEPEYFQRVRDTMELTGADGYYLLHNHPSGNPTPSKADHAMTERLAQEVRGLRAHVVINSNKYATIEAFVGDRGEPSQYAWSQSEVTEHYFGEDELHKASKPSPVLGTPISAPSQLAYLGKGLQKPGWVTVIGTGADGKVRMLAEVPESDLATRGQRQLTALVRRLRRQSGSADLFLVGSDAAMASPAVREGIRLGVIKDAVNESGKTLQGGQVLVDPTPLNIEGPSREVRDGVTPPTFAAEDGGARADMAGAEATELDELPPEFMAQEVSAAEERSNRAARRISEQGGVTSADDLRDLMSWPRFGERAESALAGDMDATRALSRALVDAFPEGDWKAPRLGGNGIVHVHADWLAGRTQSPETLTQLAELLDEYGAPAIVRGQKTLSPQAMRAAGFDTYRGMQNMRGVAQGKQAEIGIAWIRPGGGVTVSTPLREDTATYNAEQNAGFDAEPEAPPRTVDDVRKRVFAEPEEPLRSKLFRGLRNMGTEAGRSSLKAYWEGLREHLLQQVFDSFRPLQKISQRAYIAARLSTASEGTLEAFLTYGKVYLDGDTPDVEMDGNGGFLGVLARLQGEHQRFLQWVVALRAKLLRAEGDKYLPEGATRADIEALIAKLEADPDANWKALRALRMVLERSMGREHLLSDADIAALETLTEGDLPDGTSRADAYREALAALTEYNTAALTLARDSGLISTSLLEYLKDDPYVPFYRVMEEAEGSIHWSSALTGQEAFKKLRGASDKLPADMLSNVLRNWAHLFSASAKNRAARIALQEMEQAGIATKLDKPARGSVWMVDQGQPVHYQVHDESLATAIGAMTYVMPEWQRPLAKFKGVLTYGVTSLPDFKIRNLLRDTTQALALAEQIDINPLKNLAQASKTLEVAQGMKNIVLAATGKAPKHLLPQNQAFASMLASGAVLRFGNLAEHGRADHAENVIRRVRGNVILDGRTGKRLLNMIGDTWSAYTEAADASEQVNRVALYEQLRAKGYDKGEAAFMARDLMDFSLTGKAPMVRFLVQTVPFLNARLQGLYRLGRAATGGETYEAIKVNKRFANVVGSVALLSLGLMLMQQDDEDWKEREDWDRDTYWWLKIGDTAFRFPKPFEVGAVGTLAERSWEMLFNDDMTARRFGDRVANMLLGTFALNPTPQFAKPLIDLYANRDSFTGRQIESAALQQRLSADRYTADTSMLARSVGMLGIPNPLAFLNNQWSPGVNTLSPVQIDHLIGAYLGTMGVFVNRMVDGMVRPMAGEGERADRTLKQMTASFVDDLPAEQTKYLQAFYDRAERIGQVMATYRAAQKEGRFDDARELLAENPAAQAQDKRLQKVRRDLAQLALQARRVAADENLDGADKRARLDDIRRRQSDIARGVEESLPAF